jgi:hypothetical protein
MQLQCVYHIHDTHVQIEPMIGKQMQIANYNNKVVFKSYSLIVAINPSTRSSSNKDSR